MLMRKKKAVVTLEQKEFAKLKRFIDKRFPGAYTVARMVNGKIAYQVVSGSGYSVCDQALMLPPTYSVRAAWTQAKYGAWFTNMIRKSNNAFSDDKIYKKIARESGD
tara:strand:+ start:820 stop:1140 length:321 start_codon:yes stop_codon:yes gene_type:complete